MKILLLYNPQAGNGKAKKILPRVLAEFKQKKIHADLVLTEHPQHCIQIVKEADFSQYNGLAAAGGDGTLFEVINGYYQNQSTARIPIGIIPVGTGNAFIRDIQLQTSHWQEAIEVISKQQTKSVDVGYFVSGEKSSYFLNIIGLGFVAEVAKTAHKLKAFGNISYTMGVFHRLIMLKPQPIGIEIDGISYKRDVVFVEISNTRYTSNFLMAPNAKVDDGLLDITILNKMPRRKLIQHFPKIFKGEHIHLNEVDTFQAKEIKISTDTPQILTPDGELTGNTPVKIKCLQQAVKLFWT